MKFAIATLGCKVNQYDSAVIENRLMAQGLERCDFNTKADVYIVNTCTVTDRADAESLRLVRRARRLNRSARVVVTGCLAQARPAALARSPLVDRVIGLGRPEEIERAVLGRDRGEPRVSVGNLRRERTPIEMVAVAPRGQTRAFVKLQEGCDQFCSFCIVPTSRGRSRSVEPRRVLEVLDELHQQGFREVVLSGVHLGSYGADLDPPVRLEELLEMIEERCRVLRVRLSSIDPEEITPRVIDILAASKRFCEHLHLPLQSGADEILARMRRRYDSAYYRGLLERILERIPDAAVGTDLIVGFPGETHEMFERSRDLVAGLPLAYLHVFPYSVRSGTTAAKLDGRVEAAEIRRRAAVMRELGELKRRSFAARFLGRRLPVLLEGPANCDGENQTLMRGYSRNYVKMFTSASQELRNHEVFLEATTMVKGGLAGTVVPPPAQESGAGSGRLPHPAGF